jgi:hypothetical protein
MLKVVTSLLTILVSLVFLSSCEHLVDTKMVEGQWAILTDSSEMRVDFTSDSIIIGYRPDNTRHAYAYQWKQDESPGLIECYNEIVLDSAKRSRKVIPSVMYVLKVSADSISIFIPKLKTRFDLKRLHAVKQ